ncbi:MAG: aminotransferase class V-fold PLP-dependent enzyme [Coriobacteriia bacterium]|jgi:selenocysteine lyase/cysteine desulfurase|nr:aminotransferase class V-fold PLP-dependent enzyme [Coriobacteriia bacterium]
MDVATMATEASSTYESAGFEACFARFLERFPGYGSPVEVDELRAGEYARLDRQGHTYLDYTGGGLYAESQIRAHHEMLAAGIFGNPHSHNPTSLAATRLVEEAREAVLAFFNADPAEYEAIFTPNASGALRLVGESYPFGQGSCYLMSFDNHNSVNGIREFARRGGAEVVYVPVRKEDLKLDGDLLRRALHQPAECEHRLFAYPAQSNFSGVQHPLEWVAEARELGWDVVLDSAAFTPTNRLDLAVVKADFVPLSFYKMFGYPTGIGVLIARREAISKLRRPWFAGGTITLASVQAGVHRLAEGAPGFEDGTVDYLSLPAVTIGLRHLQRITIDAIHDRVTALAGWLLGEMTQLRHSNGAPMVRIFGPERMDGRGATVAFYLLDPDGAVYDVYRIERLAGERRISVRTGCFCNPGDGEVAHDITSGEMEQCFSAPAAPVTLQHCQRLIEDTTGKVPNTIRASLGVASNFADVYRFMGFLADFRDLASSRLP